MNTNKGEKLDGWKKYRTRKDLRHKNGYYRLGKRKPKYKRYWNKRYRVRPEKSSLDTFKKYTEYWCYD